MGDDSDEPAGRAIRVLVADDHDAVRQAIAMFLWASDGLELAGEATNGMEAVQMCAQLAPDVVLMDVSMPYNSTRATLAIHERWPGIPILVMTSFEEEGRVNEVLQAGAVGYVLKNVTAGELARAIREARATCNLAHDRDHERPHTPQEDESD